MALTKLQSSLESTRGHLQKELRMKEADCNRLAVQVRVGISLPHPLGSKHFVLEENVIEYYQFKKQKFFFINTYMIEMFVLCRITLYMICVDRKYLIVNKKVNFDFTLLFFCRLCDFNMMMIRNLTE